MIYTWQNLATDHRNMLKCLGLVRAETLELEQNIVYTRSPQNEKSLTLIGVIGIYQCEHRSLTVAAKSWIQTSKHCT